MKKIVVIAAVIICVLCLAKPSFCYDMPNAKDLLNDVITDDLPVPREELYDSNGNIKVDRIDSGEVLKWVFNIFKDAIGEFVSPFALIFSFIVLCSVYRSMSQTINSNSAGFVYSFVSALVLTIILSHRIFALYDETSAVLGKLITLQNGISSVMLTVYAISGNVSAAIVNAANTSIALGVISNVSKYGILPLLQVCFGLSVTGALTDTADISSLAKTVRRAYTCVIVFVMGIMAAVVSGQTVVASKTDSVAGRGLKMAAGSFVPIVGSTIGEAVRTVAGGISLLKSSVGYISIFSVAVCVVPVIIKMWAIKLSFGLGAALADMLDLKREGGLIRSAGELINFLIAVTVSVALIFIINLMIFAGSASAYTG